MFLDVSEHIPGISLGWPYTAEIIKWTPIVWMKDPGRRNSVTSHQKEEMSCPEGPKKRASKKLLKLLEPLGPLGFEFPNSNYRVMSP